MSALVTFSEVEQMLNECAPGHKIALKTHFRFVYWKGKTYFTLPKNKEIEVGHIRRMARFFNIMDCCKKYLPN